MDFRSPFLAAACCSLILLAAGCASKEKAVSVAAEQRNGSSEISWMSDRSALNDNRLKITMMDVGSGDCILVQEGPRNILIDTGDKSARNKVLSELSKANVKNLDALFLTHHDGDHIANSFEILKKFPEAKVFDNGYANKRNSRSKNLFAAFESGKYSHRALKEGDRLDFGGGLVFDVLSPGDSLVDKNGKKLLDSDMNNRSLVMKMTFNNFSMMFTGDAEAPAEDVITKRFSKSLKADVLKVGHHGSKTSSTYRFISKVMPKKAVISCGEFEKYHHPNENVVKSLEHLGADVYNTHKNGDIVVETDGSRAVLMVQKK